MLLINIVLQICNFGLKSYLTEMAVVPSFVNKFAIFSQLLPGGYRLGQRVRILFVCSMAWQHGTRMYLFMLMPTARTWTQRHRHKVKPDHP